MDEGMLASTAEQDVMPPATSAGVKVADLHQLSALVQDLSADDVMGNAWDLPTPCDVRC